MRTRYIASSKIVFNTTSLDNIKFINCNNVELFIEKVENKIKMQFLVYDTEEIEVLQKMLDALGISEFLDKRYSPKNKIILIEIKSAFELGNLQSDFTALINSYTGINGNQHERQNSRDEKRKRSFVHSLC